MAGGQCAKPCILRFSRAKLLFLKIFFPEKRIFNDSKQAVRRKIRVNRAWP